MLIGDIDIKDPVFLAPMSGISDLPFRRLVKSYGAGLVFSEMIASRALLDQNWAVHADDDFTEEFPMAVQLAGCEPDIMAEAAQLNVSRGAAIIDINFGCPVKKIVKKYAGSALMQDEDRATDIMKAVVKAVDVPVTVKMRLGWDADHKNAPSLAKKAEDVGVKLVTVHGRTRDQMYNGHADWAAVKPVSDVLNIPLIVNGDIHNIEDAKTAMAQSGADGVMIGRGTCGKPWALQQVIEALRGEDISAAPTKADRYQIIADHYDAIIDHYDIRRGVSIARKHIAWYCQDMEIGQDFINQINKEKDPMLVKEMLYQELCDA